MSGNDRIELTRAWIAALNRGDGERLVAMTHEDVTLVPMLGEFLGSPFRGHEGLRAWLHEREDVWSGLHAQEIEMREEGDAVVGTGVLRGSAHSSGVALEQPVVGVLRFRGDRAVWIGFFRTEEDALAAAGLTGGGQPGFR
ncbi:MAG TPA: nuclear transport factor 2 family protein [Thermoleophilaceae bacterium]